MYRSNAKKTWHTFIRAFELGRVNVFYHSYSFLWVCMCEGVDVHVLVLGELMGKCVMC